MNKSLGYMLFLLVFFFSCEKDTISTPPTDTNEPDADIETTTPTGDERYLNTKSDYIFDQNRLLTFELNLPAAALAAIDANPTAEEYVEGSLSFEGETISPVGIRYKGSIGAFVDCVSGNNWANPSGRKTCTKLSMKVKINWEDSDARFYGLKKLQFHSQNLDPSQMRDRLGYWFFREMGVAAPRAVHARLLINGQYSGLYALIEQIDGRFTRYNFEDGKGNLYKEVWPITDTGQAQAHSTFLNALKTNEDENPSTEMIQSFGAEIAAATEADRQAVVSKWMDVPQIMRYIAVDRTIRADDGPFHWYCGSGCENHNYYWYEETSAQKLYLIPWDLDNAFENIITNQNPVTPIVDAWGGITNDCNPFRYGFLGAQQRSAACDKLTAAWVDFEEEYEIALAAFKTGPLTIERANEQLDTWTAQVRAATQEASTAHEDAVSMEEWEASLQELKRQLEYARNK